jgi:hypothetical protein
VELKQIATVSADDEGNLTTDITDEDEITADVLHMVENCMDQDKLLACYLILGGKR